MPNRVTIYGEPAAVYQLSEVIGGYEDLFIDKGEIVDILED